MNFLLRISGATACLFMLAACLMVSCGQPETTRNQGSTSVANNDKVPSLPKNSPPKVAPPDSPAFSSNAGQVPPLPTTSLSDESGIGVTEPPKPVPAVKSPLTLIIWRGDVLIKGKKPVEKQRIDALLDIVFQNNSDFLVIQDAAEATFAIYPENFQEDTAKAIRCKGANCLPKIEPTIVFSSKYKKVDQLILRPALIRSNQVIEPIEKKQGAKNQAKQPQPGQSTPGKPTQPGNTQKNPANELKKGNFNQKQLDKANQLQQHN